MAKPLVWTKARRVWLRSRGHDTQGKVGRLYTHLFAKLLDCSITAHGRPEWGDMFSEDLGIRVENKSRSDRNAFELRRMQIEEYSEEPPFPLTYSLYTLIPWRATDPLHRGDPRPKNIGPNTHSVSRLRGLKKDPEFNAYWAKHIETSYLFDLKVIQALARKLRYKPCRMVGRSEETALQLTRTKIEEYFGSDEAFASSLETLRLGSAHLVKSVYPIQVRFEIDHQKLSSSFTLVTILHRRLHAEVAKVLAAQRPLTLM